MDILPVIEACIRNLESAGYRSFDLFDGLSSPFARPLRSGPRIVARIWQQIFLRLPVNLRRALGVRKTVSSKTLADVLKASALLRLSGVEVQTGLESLSEKILARAHRGWSGKCWGTDLPYASRVVQDGGGTPNLVTTCFCADALLSAYLVTRDARLLEAAKSACAFIADDLGELRLAEGVCFRYFPGVDEAIHNANMLGAALCARVGKLTAVQNLIDRALAATDYTVACQRADGSWYYGEKAQYHWIDNFHTGYVLDSLLTILRVAPKDDHRAAAERGLRYLVDRFFSDGVPPKFTAHRRYPVDIQGLAQTIQTLCIFADWDRRCRPLAEGTLAWTLENMSSENGYFYFRKYCTRFTNKIHYARWATGPMLVAMAHFYALSVKRQVSDVDHSLSRQRLHG